LHTCTPFTTDIYCLSEQLCWLDVQILAVVAVYVINKLMLLIACLSIVNVLIT